MESQGNCRTGFGSAVAPTYSLLAVPRSTLPSALLTINLVHRGEAGEPPGLASTVSTLIDLRPPADSPPDATVRTREAAAVVAAAAHDAVARTGHTDSVVGLRLYAWCLAQKAVKRRSLQYLAERPPVTRSL